MFGSSSTINIFVVPINSPSRTNPHAGATRGAGNSCCCLPFPRRRVDRQGDGELAAFLRRAFHRYDSAVRLRNVAHQRKPEAGTFCVVDQRIAAAVKLLKNLFLLGGGDSDPTIADFELHASVGSV